MSVGFVVPARDLEPYEVWHIVDRLAGPGREIIFVANGDRNLAEIRDSEIPGVTTDEVGYALGKAEAMRRGLNRLLQRGHSVIAQVDGHNKH